MRPFKPLPPEFQTGFQTMGLETNYQIVGTPEANMSEEIAQFAMTEFKSITQLILVLKDLETKGIVGFKGSKNFFKIDTQIKIIYEVGADPNTIHRITNCLKLRTIVSTLLRGETYRPEQGTPKAD